LKAKGGKKMEQIGGYAGNILTIDLSSSNIVKKPLELELMKNFLGGSGINAPLTYQSVQPDASPLSPGNALVFGVGPFVGTLIPGAGKSCASTKMPTSGQIDLSTTGSFGKLKFAGYDHLVITGKADQPVYLKINNDEVKILDGSHLWGKDVWETTDELWNELGKEYSIMAIGPAGENFVTDASIIGDKYAGFSRGGLGAVMGSKNLKAIAVHGTQDIKVSQPDQFEDLLDKLNTEFFGQRLLKEWRNYGTLISLKAMARTGLYAYKNFQEAVEPDKMTEAFDINAFLDIKGGDVACMSCPIGCKHLIKMKQGKYAGLTLSVGCANAAMQTWGCYCGALGQWEEVFKGAELCNRLGIDWYNASGLISWGIELYQRGIIDKHDTDGIELDWGNTAAIQELIQKIAYRHPKLLEKIRGITRFI
jgi:aldehyde:ferredoxin oxidoreductase